MILLEIKDEQYSIPTAWNELTSGQLVRVVRLFDRKELPEQAAKVELLKIMTGIGWVKMWYNGFGAIEDKLHHTEFLLKENLLTKNLFVAYDGFYGPADDFNNLLIKEFIFTEMFYQEYKDLPLEKSGSLDRMIAILYRPLKAGYDLTTNIDGDPRESFNENLTEHYSKEVSCWPMHIKLSMLQWYEGCKASLVAANDDIFSGKSTGEPAKHGLWSVMRGVAEKGVHGNIHQVEQMFLKVFMMELNELMEEAKRIEQQLQQQKPK
jgi:hypothetical protein